MSEEEDQKARELGFDPEKLGQIKKRLKKAGVDGITKLESEPITKLENITITELIPLKIEKFSKRK